MADGKIEIIENTLLKLLIRRGINADRLNVVLNEGELGYTTDTQKLFIGDGSTLGGILVTGTKFLGATGDLTTLAPGDINDIGYNTVTRQLNYISSGTGSLESDWIPISNLVVSADGTITVDSASGVKLGDCAGAGLAKDSNNKLEIGESIATNIISPKNTPYLTLPRNTAFGNINYSFPGTGSVNTYLRLNSNGQLTWSAVGGTSNTFVNSEIIPVGTIMPYTDTSLPAGNKWLNCDGAYVSTLQYPELSAVIGASFGPLSTNGGTQYFKLPDLRGKTIIGFTNTLAYDLSGVGMTFSFASSGGEYQHILSELEMPHHRHDLKHPVTGEQFYVINDSNFSDGTPNTFRADGPDKSNDARWYPFTNYAGGSGAHINMQPYLALNHIIKASPDAIAECNISISDSLTASELLLGDVFNINPLSGNYLIGLENKLEAQDVGYLTANEKGLITAFDSTSAGVINNQGANNTPVTHEFGFINFLETPVQVASVTLFSGSVPTAWSQRINVYPTLSSSLFGNLATPNVNIPNNAKNVIIEHLTQATGQGHTYTALHTDNLGTGFTKNTKEYLVGVSSYIAGSQSTVPLSANPNDGTISLAMRGANVGISRQEIAIVGWTM